MRGLRLACSCFAAIAAVLFSVHGGARGADEYAAPPQAEREAVAALRAKGASLQVDGNYRVYSIVLLMNCSNDDLKLLGAFERLVSLNVQTARITDEGIEQLKGLTNLTSISFIGSGVTEEGIAALRACVRR